jgi:hypothetical protein
MIRTRFGRAIMLKASFMSIFVGLLVLVPHAQADPTSLSVDLSGFDQYEWPDLASCTPLTGSAGLYNSAYNEASLTVEYLADVNKWQLRGLGRHEWR